MRLTRSCTVLATASAQQEFGGLGSDKLLWQSLVGHHRQPYSILSGISGGP